MHKDTTLCQMGFEPKNIQNIRILHECQVWIDKSVPRVTFWHHEARRVMPNCDPMDRFLKGFYLIWAWQPSWSCELDNLYIH